MTYNDVFDSKRDAFEAAFDSGDYEKCSELSDWMNVHYTWKGCMYLATTDAIGVDK